MNELLQIINYKYQIMSQLRQINFTFGEIICLGFKIAQKFSAILITSKQIKRFLIFIFDKLSSTAQ
jgi:hypothetical protein